MLENPLMLHSELCDDIYEILTEENKILKQAEKQVPESLLQQKVDLIRRINTSVEGLKEMNETNPTEGIQKNQLLSEVKKKMMKIFFLTKENDQLARKREFTQPEEELISSGQREKIGKAYKS